MTIHPGIKGTAETLVVHENTAAAVGSGTLEVFSTPAMIGLMENAAVVCLRPYLEEGENSVGTAISVTHDAAIPIGFTVTAEAELIEVDRRRLEFKVMARAGDEIIGKGVHTRFIVPQEKFMQKVEAKLRELG